MTLRMLALALLTVTPLPAAAQQPGRAEPVDRATIARIRAEGLDRSQAPAMYSHLANVIGPRLTATPAHRRAAEWARERFASWGLSNPRLEAFDFGRGWTLERLTLEMIEPWYFPLSGYPDAWSPSTRGVIEGSPVYLGDKAAGEIQAMAQRLRGAIVLAQPPQTRFITADRPQPGDSDQRVRIGAPGGVSSQGPTALNDMRPLLQEAGAGVVLRPNQGQHGTIFVTGNRNTANEATPSIVLASEHYNLIVRILESGTPIRLRIGMETHYHETDRNGYNVLAEIPGTDPVLRNEVVMIGGHLDSWHSATGATDNADGSVAVLEAARILTAIGARPRRTIRFALWAGEEQGLLGARAWVERNLARDANAAAREAFSVYFNDDPGTGATYGFYAEENAAAKAIFDAWLEPLRDLGVKHNVMDPIGSTDHLNFTRIRLPGFTTLKDYVDYDVRTHHTNTDFFERTSEADVKQSAIVLAVFAWQAAIRDQKIPRPPLLP